MPDDLDRDKMYRADDDDDDVEYEVEPPDPHVIAAEERRTQDSIAAAKYHIDIEDIYREHEGRDSQSLDHLLKDVKFRFQFQVKHLLIGTAILAVLLTLTQAAGFGTVLILLFMAGVWSVTFYLQWNDFKRRQEADRRRNQLYAERRAYMMRRNAGVEVDEPDEEAPPPAPLPPDAFDAARDQAAAADRLRIKFSREHIIAAVICIAAVFGLTYALGGLATTMTVCGLLAIVGLVVYAIGYQPPDVVVFVWWTTLLAYVALSILTTIFGLVG